MTNYLLIGPHPDDVELGCLSSILSMIKSGDKISYLIMTKCLNLKRNKNIMSEMLEVSNVLHKLFKATDVKYSMTIHDFKNQKLRKQDMEIRLTLEKERDSFEPDVIISSSPRDLHQDHSYIGEEVLRVFKSKTIWNYEVPISTQDFNPNLFVVISETVVDMSLDILAIYKSQNRKSYMRRDLALGTLKHRGRSIGRDFAQAFEIRRMVIDVKNESGI